MNNVLQLKITLMKGISAYSYDIGYILGKYVNNSVNKVELLNMLLNYKDKGILLLSKKL